MRTMPRAATEGKATGAVRPLAGQYSRGRERYAFAEEPCEEIFDGVSGPFGVHAQLGGRG